jgi:hypothetical protein
VADPRPDASRLTSGRPVSSSFSCCTGAGRSATTLRRRVMLGALWILHLVLWLSSAVSLRAC